MCNKNENRKTSCWNEMEELKYLICAIDCCKCEHVPPPPSCSIMLPPRIEEIPCIIPPQRPVCRPSKSCRPPIASGPCCPCPLPKPPPPRCPPPPPTGPPCCPPCSPLPCYPKPYC